MENVFTGGETAIVASGMEAAVFCVSLPDLEKRKVSCLNDEPGRAVGKEKPDERRRTANQLFDAHFTKSDAR